MQTQSKLKLGIFGGGQLAQMLIDQNPFSDLEIHVFTDNSNCPAKSTHAKLTIGSPDNLKDLNAFIQKADIFTFENEFLDMNLFNEVQKKHPRKLFFPQIPVLKTVQNKLNQKFIFKKLQLPTSPFVAFDPMLEKLESWCSQLFNLFPKGCMLKWAQGGYDGKGNFLFQNINSTKDAIDFCKFAIHKNTTVYAEQLIDFKYELSMIYARSLKGEFIHYPLVISEQENNICKTVYGPATEFQILQNIENFAIEYGKKISNEFSYVGVFALEFFLTQDNQLLINEMAPRVHNSGHYTLDACLLNQFSCHLKAILGSDLGTISYFPFFAMQNLIGNLNLNPLSTPNTTELDPFKLYWYNKSDGKPGRKLGHLNTVGTSRGDLELKIKKMKDFEQKLKNIGSI